MTPGDPKLTLVNSAMDRQSALEAIKESLARGSGTPCTWREDREAYIAEESDQLLASVIDPVEVQVADSEYMSQVTSDLEGRKYFAIAHAANDWLIFTPESSEFAKASGNSTEDLVFCGFYSSDALAEWLG